VSQQIFGVVAAGLSFGFRKRPITGELSLQGRWWTSTIAFAYSSQRTSTMVTGKRAKAAQRQAQIATRNVDLAVTYTARLDSGTPSTWRPASSGMLYGMGGSESE
jgi:hypothetical protein